jgi:hypothetical protein
MWDSVAIARVVLVDETLSTASTTLHYPATIEAVEALSDAIQLAGLIDVISGANVCNVEVVYRYVLLQSPPGTGHVNAHGVLIFDCSAEQFYVCAIPGIIPALVLPASDGAVFDLDHSNSLLLDLVDLLTTGVWCNPFGEPITGLAEAYLQQRTYGAIYIP